MSKGWIKNILRVLTPMGSNNFPIIIIGSSTGGPPIVEEILSFLPENFPACILVVQHMPKHFTNTFAQRLEKILKNPVKEAADNDKIVQGQILIAPGDYHMGIVGDTIKLNSNPPLHGLRPSIDVTMKDAAIVFPNRTIGVVLTGMGDDGTDGMRMIKESGGTTIVQTPGTSVVDSMPQSVITAGFADEVLPPEKIGARLIALCQT